MHFEEFLASWRNTSSTKLQIALLTRIAAALRDSPDCAGAVVVGSFAKASADRLSDIDLVAFCSDGAGHSLFQTIKQQIDPAKVLFTLDGAHDAGSPFQKLIFDDWTSVEFHVVSAQTELTVEQPFVAVVNRDHYLESRTSLRLAPLDRDMNVFRYGDHSLACELFNCMKWLWRGDYAIAKRYLVKLGKAIEASEASSGSLT